LFCLMFPVLHAPLPGAEFSITSRQITTGPNHHFFGYIGQSLTIPWNESGRFILSLRTSFHDRMPHPGEAAEIVLIDTQNNYRFIPIENTRAWNFQQGTMIYWHPEHPETQFFFNDRDPKTHQIFTVLYDIEKEKRVREFRFENPSVANGGVSPTGEFFMAINYGRMARLRPVTGYPGVADSTSESLAPENDGIFRIDISTGQQKLLVSFKQLKELIQDKYDHLDEVEFYINHTLVNRVGEYVYFYTRGHRNESSMYVNVPCSIRTDGTELKTHQFIGGHPEWDLGTVVIGAQRDQQVMYDIQKQKIVGQIGPPGLNPNPKGDISLSPDGNWFVCGYGTNRSQFNKYLIIRRSDGQHVFSETFSRGPYKKGNLRVDPAPRWNRNQTALLVPGFTKEGTRQLHLIEIKK